MQNRSINGRVKDPSSSSFKLPGSIKTSAQIIEDARRSVRLVPTSRPYTPAGSRNLFGATNRTTGSRPPSTVSIGQTTSYTDEALLQVRPVPGRLLEPISPQFPVPPTPVQSVVNVIDPIKAPHVSSTNQKLPELKKSKVSPSTSRRITSAEKRKGDGGGGPGSQMKLQLIKSGSGQTEGHVKPIDRVMSGTRREAVLEWERNIIPLMKSLEEEESSTERMKELCDDILRALQDGGFVGRTAGHAGKNRRSVLLRCLFQLLKYKDSTVLAKVLKIMLLMKVVGSNLCSVCQQLFSLSKEEANDEILIKESIAGPLVEILLTVDPLTEINTAIYGLGAIKLFSSNQTLRASLRTAGVVEMLASYLKVSSQIDSQMPSSVFVQLIGCLRNLSDSVSIYEDFITHKIIAYLPKAVVLHQDNAEIVYYTSRLLSKLALHTESNLSLSQCDELIGIIPELIAIHHHNQDIVVRLFFVLGNITLTNASLSYNLYHTHKLHPSIDKVLNYYFRAIKTQLTDDPHHQTKTMTDVIVKVVRLIANICVHQSVATQFVKEKQTMKLLLTIIGHLSVNVSEELVINTLVAFNNLSYHVESLNEFHTIEKDLVTVIVDLLLVNNDEVLLECVRVLGNISKQESVRNMITINRVDELLVTLLDSNKLELVFSSCGVLVNLMVDNQHKQILQQNRGIKKLVDVLSHFGRQDWQLSGLVCKILWNYHSDDDHRFNEDERMNIVHLLEEFLDPVTAFTAYMMEEDSTEEDDDGPSTQAHTFWENEFSPVAIMLIQKLQSNSKTMQV